MTEVKMDKYEETSLKKECLDVFVKSKPEIVKSVPVVVSALCGFLLGRKTK